MRVWQGYVSFCWRRMAGFLISGHIRHSLTRFWSNMIIKPGGWLRRVKLLGFQVVIGWKIRGECLSPPRSINFWQSYNMLQWQFHAPGTGLKCSWWGRKFLTKRVEKKALLLARSRIKNSHSSTKQGDPLPQSQIIAIEMCLLHPMKKKNY